MKFLIIRFSSIGDIVLTTPVIRCLKKKFPASEVHYATKKAFRSIIEKNPYVDKVHSLEGSTMALANKLRGENFDCIIDLHHNQRTLLLKWLLGKKSFSFNKINLEKWLMVTFKINRLPGKHIVDRYLETCLPLGVENDYLGLDYFLSPEDEIQIHDLPTGFHQGYIGWVTGAKQNTKKFPISKIIHALQYINYPVILLGGKEDAPEAEKIISSLSAHAHSVYNACGKYSLNQSASLIKQAKFIISNDTGLAHIAAAFKKPVISIWGNTIPEFGMSPYYGRPGIVNPQFEIKDLNCRPCSKLGFNECPQNHFNCMNKIDEKEIAIKVNEMVNRQW